MEIADLIKDLRNKTGAGFLDCKNALNQNNNNLDEAVEFLRKKGLAKASKKSTREANEGAIGIYSNEKITAILKINSETDFAAKGDKFLNFMDELGQLIIDTNNANLTKDEFLNLKLHDSLVSDYFKNMISQIGENLILNEMLIYETHNSFYSSYIHNSYRKNIGKIISLVEYSANNNNEEIKTLSKNLCMHVAAMKPESLDISDLNPKIIENEKKIQRELILNSGKPNNIIEKILEGKMNKFFSEVTLLNQNYILDQDKKVSDVLQSFNKSHKFEIISFNIVNL